MLLPGDGHARSLTVRGSHRTLRRMVVGLMTVALRVSDASSLKDKRRVVKRLVSRVRAKFNVAVAEVDTHDARHTITLGVACVSTDRAHAHSMLEKVAWAIDNERVDAEMMDYRIEFW
jgi:uncharacterized protein YlxP (DUF503 family)